MSGGAGRNVCITSLQYAVKEKVSLELEWKPVGILMCQSGGGPPAFEEDWRLHLSNGANFITCMQDQRTPGIWSFVKEKETETSSEEFILGTLDFCRSEAFRGLEEVDSLSQVMNPW